MRDAKAEFEGGVQIGGERLNNLRFADDTVLLCNSKEELTHMIQLHGEGQKCGKRTSS